MRISLSKYQRAALVVAASAICVVQLIQFNDQGFRGHGWVISFVIVTLLMLVALSRNSTHNSVGSDAIHASLNKDSDVLFAEVEQRADSLATSLFAEHDVTKKGLVVTAQGSVELGQKACDSLLYHMQECCVYLMFGLITIRKSSGNAKYIKGAEFKELQKNVQTRILEMHMQKLTEFPTDIEIDPDRISKIIKSDMQSVRATIIKCCVSRGSGQEEPEIALLDWFKSRCGVSVRGKVQISRALFHQQSQS